MSKLLRVLGTLALAAGLVGFAPVDRPAAATVVQYGGAFLGWPADGDWIPIADMADPTDALSYLGEALMPAADIVGDGNDPAVYWFSNNQFLFFRIRVALDEVIYDPLDPLSDTRSFQHSHFIFIDQDADGVEDYGFVWDSRYPPPPVPLIDPEDMWMHHGLELMERSGDVDLADPVTYFTNWLETNLDDADGWEPYKCSSEADGGLPCTIWPDFGLADGTGYIRTIDGVTTDAFGLTTYIDFAVQWAHLSAHTPLAKNQTWKIQVGTANLAVDHDGVTGDVAGNQDGSTQKLWSTFNLATGPTAVEMSNLSAQPGVRGWLAGLLLPAAALFGLLGYGALKRRK